MSLAEFIKLSAICEARGWKLGVERGGIPGETATLRIVIDAGGAAEASAWVPIDRLDGEARKMREVLAA